MPLTATSARSRPRSVSNSIRRALAGGLQGHVRVQRRRIGRAARRHQPARVRVERRRAVALVEHEQRDRRVFEARFQRQVFVEHLAVRVRHGGQVVGGGAHRRALLQPAQLLP
jgi:hypothetical protein